MLQFLFPAVILLLAIAVIVFILVRHFPQAAAIDVDALPAEQEAARKAALMERRLKRKIFETQKKILPAWRKIKQVLSKVWMALHARVVQLEQRYRKKTHTMTSEEQEDVKQKLRQLLEQAKQSFDSERFSDAEQKYIEVLSWDHKNADAYFGLAKVYIDQKEFQQAQETLAHLLKIVHTPTQDEQISRFSTPIAETQVTEAHYDYAVCLQVLGDAEGASQQITICVQRDAKNPKYLDKVVELHVLAKDRSAAFRALDALKEVNPENQKIASFETQIRGLPF